MEENMATREEQLEEALRRMRYLKLHSNVLKDLEEDGLLHMSERSGPFDGILYWVEEEEHLRQIRNFERRNGAFVYHVIRSRTTFGDLLSMLYVTNFKDEWKYDREDLMEGYAVAYVENLSDPACSESGSICIEPVNGGLVRIG